MHCTAHTHACVCCHRATVRTDKTGQPHTLPDEPTQEPGVLARPVVCTGLPLGLVSWGHRFSPEVMAPQKRLVRAAQNQALLACGPVHGEGSPCPKVPECRVLFCVLSGI